MTKQELMDLFEKLNKLAEEFGIDVLDVQMKISNLPAMATSIFQVREGVYMDHKMAAEYDSARADEKAELRERYSTDDDFRL